ncbi:hypothetical protein [Pseudobythopirellula maris]|nr:hypothetical protein [Pseudobythopirellula maris]
MHLRRLLLLVGIATTGATIGVGASAQEAKLSVLWNEGDEAVYLTTQSMAMTIDAGQAGTGESVVEQTAEVSWNVESIDEGGAERIATIRQQPSSMRVEVTGPGAQHGVYDTADEAPPEGVAALLAPSLDSFVRHGWAVQIDARGASLGVALPEAVEKSVGVSSHEPAIRTALDNLATLAAPTLPNELQSGAAEPGFEWTIDAGAGEEGAAPSLAWTCRYAGVRDVQGDPVAVFEWVGAAFADESIKVESTAGEALLDLATGQPVRCTRELEFIVTTEGATTRVKQKFEAQRVD